MLVIFPHEKSTWDPQIKGEVCVDSEFQWAQSIDSRLQDRDDKGNNVVEEGCSPCCKQEKTEQKARNWEQEHTLSGHTLMVHSFWPGSTSK